MLLIVKNLSKFQCKLTTYIIYDTYVYVHHRQNCCSLWFVIKILYENFPHYNPFFGLWYWKRSLLPFIYLPLLLLNTSVIFPVELAVEMVHGMQLNRPLPSQPHMHIQPLDSILLKTQSLVQGNEIVMNQSKMLEPVRV